MCNRAGPWGGGGGGGMGWREEGGGGVVASQQHAPRTNLIEGSVQIIVPTARAERHDCYLIKSTYTYAGPTSSTADPGDRNTANDPRVLLSSRRPYRLATEVRVWGRVVVVVCWLLNVPVTCQCISGTDLLRQFYVLPH